ncbi:MAG TPA: FAD-dependent oxidoreductase [Rhabdaerophilum sp.]|nr:FAD-dependent oxidoreductase [Rhabdaerophilum sp.]
MISRDGKVLIGTVLALAIVLLALLLRDQDAAMLMAYRDRWMEWAAARPLLSALIYVATYIAFTAMSLPGALVLTLIGGSLFGLWWGTLLTSLASTLGATLAMLSSRYLFRDFVEARFAAIIRRIDDGLARDGSRYLFTLRLIPVFPFFLVNLAMGVTRMKVWTFFWVSQIAMLPATLLYTNAGEELKGIEAARDLLSPGVVFAFAALAVLPFASKFLARLWNDYQMLAKWRRPSHFDYNLVILGGGAAGLVASYVAAAAQAKVALVEQESLGGDCLKSGCVPSKALIRSARLAHEAQNAEEFGLAGVLSPDFGKVMARIRRVIARVEPHDSEERYSSLGVEVVRGAGRIVDPWRVAVGERVLTTRNILVATGASPILPPLPGLAACGALTSDTLWSLETLPARLLVLGGGPIGCELAQAFARLGSRVTLVEGADQLLIREDEDVGAALADALRGEGIELVLGVKAVEVRRFAEDHVLMLADGRELAFDRILVAVGRAPRLKGFGLEELGLVENGRLVFEGNLRTRIPTIYAAGDVTGKRQFTHAAGHDGWVAAMNALTGLRRWTNRVEGFPAVTYTDPEIARVGLNRREAMEQGVAFEETRFDLAELDRAICEGANRGFVSVLTVPGSDRILGATIVGAHAGEILGEFTLAMKHGLGLGKILTTIHPYPGWGEAAKSVAGEWRRAHVPDWSVALARRFNDWRRG